MKQQGRSRRTVLAAGGGAAAAAAAALAGCSTYGSGGGPQTRQPNQGPVELARTGDIPVGGGTVFDSSNVVVTQPTAGVFKGYSAICTHQGCVVVSVSGGTINCPCHGSAFNIADGSVAQGPARSPLRKVNLTIDGDSIKLG